MEELISVIVPIYKTEKYLRKCVDSILNQTYRNLEIILVNDGSPDNSGEICDEYAKKDRRIKVLHQENGGIAVAMNNGIDASTGDFIATVDSDDYIHKQMFEVLHRNIKKYDADLSVCGFTYVNDKDESNINKYHTNEEKNETITVYNSKDALGKLYDGPFPIYDFAWNKLYRKELFKDISYFEGKMYEDVFIAHRILDKTSKVVVSNYSLYYYLQRIDSITGASFNFTSLDLLEALEDRMIFLKDKGYNKLFMQTHKAFLEFAITFYYRSKRYYPNEVSILKELKSKFIKVFKQENNQFISKTTQLRYTIFCISPFLQEIILNVHIFVQNKLARSRTY